jgi:hypothetical protein
MDPWFVSKSVAVFRSQKDPPFFAPPLPLTPTVNAPTEQQVASAPLIVVPPSHPSPAEATARSQRDAEVADALKSLHEIKAKQELFQEEIESLLLSEDDAIRKCKALELVVEELAAARDKLVERSKNDELTITALKWCVRHRFKWAGLFNCALVCCMRFRDLTRRHEQEMAAYQSSLVAPSGAAAAAAAPTGTNTAAGYAQPVAVVSQ